jgi:hypothetical protein
MGGGGPIVFLTSSFEYIWLARFEPAVDASRVLSRRNQLLDRFALLSSIWKLPLLRLTGRAPMVLAVSVGACEAEVDGGAPCSALA